MILFIHMKESYKLQAVEVTSLLFFLFIQNPSCMRNENYITIYTKGHGSKLDKLLQELSITSRSSYLMFLQVPFSAEKKGRRQKNEGDGTFGGHDTPTPRKCDDITREVASKSVPRLTSISTSPLGGCKKAYVTQEVPSNSAFHSRSSIKRL